MTRRTAPAVVIGFPAPDPHRRPLCLHRLHRGDVVHRVVLDGELRIVHVPHRREPGQRLRVLDVEGLARRRRSRGSAALPAVVDLVEYVDHHVVAGRQHVADIVVAEVGFLAEVLTRYARTSDPSAECCAGRTRTSRPVRASRRRLRRAPPVPGMRLASACSCGWSMYGTWVRDRHRPY